MYIYIYIYIYQKEYCNSNIIQVLSKKKFGLCKKNRILVGTYAQLASPYQYTNIVTNEMNLKEEIIDIKDAHIWEEYKI